MLAPDYDAAVGEALGASLRGRWVDVAQLGVPRRVGRTDERNRRRSFDRAMSFRRRTKREEPEKVRNDDEDEDSKASGASGRMNVRKKKSGGGKSAQLLSFDDDGGEGEGDDDGAGVLLKKTKNKSRRGLAPRAMQLGRGDEKEAKASTTSDAGRSYDVASLKALASEQVTLRDRPEEHAGTPAAEASGVRMVGDIFGKKEDKEWLPPPPARVVTASYEEDAVMTEIPDEKTIAEAKAKREAARQKTAAAPDYIDLDSRNSERVAFKGARQDARAQFVDHDQLTGSDAEDMDEFERAQLLRVFKDEPDMKRAVRSTQANVSNSSGERVSVEQGGMDALGSLRSALEAAQLASSTARKEAVRAEENTKKSQEALQFYEKELQGASERYVYTQKLRDYFRDACAMLYHKDALLAELEAHYKKFHAARAAALSEAIAIECEESLIEAQAAVNAINSVLQKGGSQSEATAAAVAAADKAVFEVKKLDQERFDDMGRDLNIAMREKAKERSKRRREDDNFSFKVEDQREIDLFHKDWSEAQAAANALLKDASEEFSTLRAVKRRAEEWKRTHLNSYKNTYMSLSVPSLFAPFVRLELIGWSPLFPAKGLSIPTALDDMSWYKELFDYGLIDGKMEENDEDANLLPNIVQNIILPIAEEAVEKWWEPRNVTQSKALASTLKDIFVYIEPSENEDSKEVLMMLQRRLKRGAEECVVPTYSPIVTACSATARSHAAAQFHLSLDVIRSCLAFDSILDRLVLQRIIAEVLVADRIVPYVRLLLVDAAECARALTQTADALPEEWLRAAPKGVEALKEIAQSLVQSAQHGDTQTKESAQKLAIRFGIASK